LETSRFPRRDQPAYLLGIDIESLRATEAECIRRFQQKAAILRSHDPALSPAIARAKAAQSLPQTMEKYLMVCSRLTYAGHALQPVFGFGNHPQRHLGALQGLEATVAGPVLVLSGTPVPLGIIVAGPQLPFLFLFVGRDAQTAHAGCSSRPQTAASCMSSLSTYGKAAVSSLQSLHPRVAQRRPDADARNHVAHGVVRVCLAGLRHFGVEQDNAGEKGADAIAACRSSYQGLVKILS
jgi:hypothetical protein